jgi:hypothetical protein
MNGRVEVRPEIEGYDGVNRRSAENFPFGDVAGDVEQLDLIDGFEISLVPDLPDDLFVRRHLEDLRLPGVSR